MIFRPENESVSVCCKTRRDRDYDRSTVMDSAIDAHFPSRPFDSVILYTHPVSVIVCVSVS